MSEEVKVKINVKEIITFFGMLIIGCIFLFYSNVFRHIFPDPSSGIFLASLFMVLGIIHIISGLIYLMVLITKKVRRFIKERK